MKRGVRGVSQHQARRVLAGILLVALLIAPVLAPQLHSARQGATIIVPAVEEPTRRGVLIGVNITIEPGGRGEIEVTSGGSVDDTTRYSITQALVTGAVLAGYDWRLFNYKVHFLNASRVSGPSASAAVATAAYLLLRGSPSLPVFEQEVVMTGAISPLGLYSAIGGVPEKCHATAEVGRSFYYPLANLNRSMPGCEGVAVSVGGILGAVERLMGVNVTVAPMVVPMPGEFNESMINASRYMSSVARDVLEGLSGANISGGLEAILETARRALNESNATLHEHPYVSASRAFYALYNAFLLEYAVNLADLRDEGLLNYIEEEAARLSQNLTSLETSLSALPQNGSALYVEFLGIAYARIASAEYELEKIDTVARADPFSAISTLAYAKARIYSVRSWIWSALAVRNLTPTLTLESVKRLSSYAGDFIHISTNYSISLANYMIETYRNKVDRELLESSVEALIKIIQKGDAYSSTGNYVAALGFYREALSQSMNTIFSVTITNETLRNLVLKGYINETIKTYNYLVSRIIWEGLPPGLAPAYLDYSLYLLEKGDTDTALAMARSAVSSALIWYLYTIIEEQPRTGQGGGPSLLSSVMNEEGALLTIATAGLLGVAAGVLVVGWLLVRAMRRAALHPYTPPANGPGEG